MQSQPPPQQPQGSQFPPAGQNLRQNFQTIRFPSGQVVTQNQQFGVISNSNPAVQQQFGFANTQQFPSQPQAPPSSQPQSSFAQFDSQFGQAQQQRFPPSQEAGLSFQSNQGIQSSSALSQSFRPLQSSSANQESSQQPFPPPIRQLDDQQIAQTADQALDFSRAPEQFRSTTFAPQFDNGIQQDLINGARVRLRPLSTTVGSIGSSESQQPAEADVSSLSRRPVSRVRTRPTTPVPAGSQTLFDRFPVRELPRNPSPSRERRPVNNFVSSTPSPTTKDPVTRLQEFIRGASDESPTPPPIISRVRGRPIVPEDFPGPSQAVRGATPDDEEGERQTAQPSRGSFSNPRERQPSGSGSGRGSSSGGRVRNRVRIVPTGNRARQPVSRTPVVQEQKANVDQFREQPRASGNTGGRPRSNRLPFTATDLDDKEEVDVNDLPDSKPPRRLRPATRITSSSPPRRKLRPFTTEEPPRTESTRKNLISLIPTVPARQRGPGNIVADKTSKPKPVSSTTSIANLLSTDDFDLAAVVEALRANSREQFDLDILNAQVKAVEHEQQLDLTGSRDPPKFSSPTNSIPFDDDNEESNIIPFADVPSDDGVNNDPEDLDGSAITVINLQKDRARQNFKGFIDTDLIDDSLRKSTPRSSQIFVPTISPQFRVNPTLRTTTKTTRRPISTFGRTSTSKPVSSSSAGFLPTSLPPLRENERTTSRASTTTRRSTAAVPTSTTSKQAPQQNKENKVSVSVSTSLSSTSSSSSSSSSSQARIHDELDKLQSALDPWAIINNNDKSTPSSATTETTTRLSLFNVRTLPTKRTTTTTTFKPRSLADLFKIRNGQKITQDDDKEEEVRASPAIAPFKNTSFGSQNKEKKPSFASGQSTIEKLKSRLDKFRPKKASTTKAPSTTTKTTRKSNSTPKKQKKRPKTVKDLLGIII